ncbi:LrgB family protein [Clostridium guangxiense]|uniref:LrgB family protein n=1 Tax=Clostridium guangxiense TaxID=1662055 RepID=UPI001E5A0195|nr:LrgB family protein [Clostridium guangxiense]MCD2348381.1 LrgB family protein [Clostridium guangxiense]
MDALIHTSLFSILISLIAFEAGLFLYKKTKLSIFNPLLISIIIVIFILKGLNITLNQYNAGGQFISFFLGPSTVILAVPLYKKIDLLKKNIVPILLGISIGSIFGMLSIAAMCHIFKLPNMIDLSLLPKSVTTPIGQSVSKQIGGIPAVTVAAIVLTGVFGSIIGPLVFKLFRIKDPVAMGIAMGTSSHAIGTTKAIEIGETQGAMSSLSIGVAGLITVIVAPIIVKILSLIL